jgi:hypothetical protein
MNQDPLTIPSRQQANFFSDQLTGEIHLPPVVTHDYAVTKESCF